jgi:hypothetical protein
MRRLLPCLAFAAALATASAARAEGTAMRLDLVEPKSIHLDGVPKEWNQMVHFDQTLKGSMGKPDCDAKGAIAYDASSVFVAVDVTDDDLRAGGDHVELAMGFPGGVVHDVLIYPGDPGKSPGSVRFKGGGSVPGARVVEAPHEGGWSLEAQIPWASFPESRLVRVGMRGALFFHDADGGTSVKNLVGTASSNAYASLPPLTTEPEQALQDGLMTEKALRSAPKCNLVANVVGDETKERVLVFEHYLVVLGPNYRKGTEYYFTDLDAEILSCEARDVTGDGVADILIKKRVGSGSRTRDTLLIMSFLGNSETPTAVFQHEYAIATDAGSVTNDLTIGERNIRVTPGQARGVSAANWREPTESSWDAALLPWGTIASQTYKFAGNKFEKADEQRQAGVAAPPPRATRVAATELPAAPPPPSAAELQSQVYDLYKKDRGATARPRFDLAVDVSGDGRAERVLLSDRDIVVFGKGFKGGTGYTYLTLTQFAAASDILEVTARDVTGDGKAEIIVRGVQHAPAPANAGGPTVDREVVLVFAVVGEQLKRVFAAEIGRAVGGRKITGTLTLRAGEIVLSPGRASEWTEKTYPFGQDTSPVGGYEPLLLPWGGAQPAHYRWSNGAFSR